MNIDNIRNSATTSKTEVTSKYFPKDNDIDESLSEFQEKKKVTGPRNIKSKSKKKLVKRRKSQKDIRILINKKKNDLEKYSKDFDNLCKQSGIDVDSEQLQLAIALSKSLQDTERVSTPVETPDDAKPLSSQERTLKIRTTLQEYGFKVLGKPEPKVLGKCKKARKQRKHYKLLTLSDLEKQQIIADKYAQLLFNNVCNIECNAEFILSDTLYYKTTNISYDDIKNDNLFFVSNLFEKSSNNINLLRSWSEIPGRAISPLLEGPYISFNDIRCSQEELDGFLSGSMKSAQELIHKKLRENFVLSNSIKYLINPCKSVEESNRDTIHTHKVYVKDNEMSKSMLLVSEQVRSKSPDLFDDDEVSSIMDVSKVSDKSSEINFKSITNHHHYTMDLTECVNIETNINFELPNVTRKISNDLTKIIDCVVQLEPDLEIDLTQDLNEEQSHNKTIDYCDTEKMFSKKMPGCDDLIYVVDETDDDPNTSNTSVLNNTSNEIVVINLKPNAVVKDLHIVSPQKSDIQTYETKRDLNMSKISVLNNTSIEVVTIDLEPNAVNDIHVASSQKNIVTNLCSNEAMDLSQTSDSSIELPDIQINGKIQDISLGKAENEIIIINEDCYDIIHQTSSDTKEIHSKVIDLTSALQESTCSYIESNNKIEDKSELCNENVNLTQSSNSSIERDTESINKINLSKSHSSCGKLENLGKKDNISIDYDEMFDNIKENCSNVSKYSKNQETNIDIDISISLSRSKSVISNHETKKSKDSFVNEASTSNQSESFELSDKELNYSVNKLRHENFDFGGLSVLGNFSDDERLKNNTSMNNSYLPPVNVKDKPMHNALMENIAIEIDIQQTSPTNAICKESYDIIKTPGNKEYLVKTDQVTPMPNYEAMSTPQMYKELDKYGIKPFKRKRAIKLLTYIYNQTHPIVDSCIEDASTSKKQKTSIQTSQKKVLISPKKAPKNNLIIDKENEIYTQTNDKPVLKEIECSPEDWVFQKREKAKIHSCRVPLHIAFHNYISSRGLLREAILCYEPINIDVIHKDLVAMGYRYNPKIGPEKGVAHLTAAAILNSLLDLWARIENKPLLKL